MKYPNNYLNAIDKIYSEKVGFVFPMSAAASDSGSLDVHEVLLKELPYTGGDIAKTGVYDISMHININGAPDTWTGVFRCPQSDSETVEIQFRQEDIQGDILEFSNIEIGNITGDHIDVIIYNNEEQTPENIWLAVQSNFTKPTLYFYISNQEDGSNTISIKKNSVPTTGKTLAYSFDMEDWKTCTYTSSLCNITLNSGDVVYLRSSDGFSKSSAAYYNITSTGRFIIGGDASTIINYNGITNTQNYVFYKMFTGNTNIIDASPLKLQNIPIGQYCFDSMFFNCTNLEYAPELPATTLAQSCYHFMFRGCGIHTAPELPATTLANNCYEAMFAYCSDLTTAPELPATTLANNCYRNMFSTTGLTTAPTLNATILKEGCYQGMFDSCTSLTTAPTLNATTMYKSCYQSMFNGCTSLATAPVLPATTLAQNCYQYMFNGCTSLATAPVLPATTLAQNCYQYMFSCCTSLTSVPNSISTVVNMAQGCYYGMFQGCTSLTGRIYLPATVLAEQCYHTMFSGCTGIEEVELEAIELVGGTNVQLGSLYQMLISCSGVNKIITHATSWNNSYSSSWVTNVSNTGDFYNLGGATIVIGNNGIPSNWIEHNSL